MFKTEILFLDWSDTCRYKFLLTCDSFPDPVKTRTNGLMDFGVGRVCVLHRLSGLLRVTVIVTRHDELFQQKSFTFMMMN